jgi:hypothetical protein
VTIQPQQFSFGVMMLFKTIDRVRGKCLLQQPVTVKLKSCVLHKSCVKIQAHKRHVNDFPPKKLPIEVHENMLQQTVYEFSVAGSKTYCASSLLLPPPPPLLLILTIITPPPPPPS